MAVITDGQAEIVGGYDFSLIIGDNTDYRFPTDFFQWWTAAEVRTSDYPRSGADGYTPGRDLLGKYVTNIVVNILADDEADLGDKIDAWKLACAATPDTYVMLRANMFGRTRLRVGRFRIPGEVLVDQWSLASKTVVDDCVRFVARGSAQFECFDSRTYDDELQLALTGRSIAGSGFEVPFEVPFTLGSGTPGVVIVMNAGNRPAPWTARLDGPLAYPAISHLESGRQLYLALTANGGVDLAAGQWIDFDSATRSVLLNGTADRRSNLTVDSDWWDLLVGDNTFQLDADSGSGTLQIAWRNAWLS